MYAAPPPIAIIAIIPIIIPTIFPLFVFFVVERSVSTCSMNFSSIVGSFEASSSFLGICVSVFFLPHFIQNLSSS